MNAPINVARSSWIPRRDLKTSAPSALDVSRLDEKQGVSGNEPSVTEDVRIERPRAQDVLSLVGGGKPFNGRHRFTPKEVSDALAGASASLLEKVDSSLSAAQHAQTEKASVRLKEVGVSQSAWAVVEEGYLAVDLPPRENEPLTAQRLREVLDVLDESQRLLEGRWSRAAKEVKHLFGIYEKQLKTVETIIRQGWAQAVGQPKQGALASPSPLVCFTDEQVDAMTDHVNHLSALSLKITQSSKSLCQVPGLRGPKVMLGVSVSLGFATASILTCLGFSLPIIGAIAGSVSIIGAILFYAWEKYQELKAEQWQKRINELVNFTQQLEHLKDAAIMERFTAIKENFTAIKENFTQHATSIQDQSQKIENLEAKYQQLMEMNLKLMDKVEALEKEKAALSMTKLPQVNAEAITVRKDSTRNALA